MLETTGESFAQVLAPGGTVVASSPQVVGRIVGPGVLAAAGSQSGVERPVLLASEGEAEPALLLLRGVDGQVLLVGASRDPVDDALDKVLTQLLIGGHWPSSSRR